MRRGCAPVRGGGPDSLSKAERRRRAAEKARRHRCEGFATQLREDRILEEARAADCDPLHIATMFGLTAQPALRYAKTIWSI